jgi:hypothetical protein
MQIFNASITAQQALTVSSVYQFGRNAMFARPRSLLLQGSFVSGGNGTSVDAWVQTAWDGGNSWWDIAQFHFTGSSAAKAFNLSALTPVTAQATQQDGQMGSNTSVDGLIGARLRVKWQTSGTYLATTTFTIDVHSDIKITTMTQ